MSKFEYFLTVKFKIFVFKLYSYFLYIFLRTQIWLIYKNSNFSYNFEFFFLKCIINSWILSSVSDYIREIIGKNSVTADTFFPVFKKFFLKCISRLKKRLNKMRKWTNIYCVTRMIWNLLVNSIFRS